MSSPSPWRATDVAVVVSSPKRVAATAMSWLASRAFAQARIDHVASMDEIFAVAAQRQYALAFLHFPNPRASWSAGGARLKQECAVGNIVMLVESADSQAVRLSRVARWCSILDANTESVGALCGRLRRALAGHTYVSASIRAAAARQAINPELLLTDMEERVLAVIGTGADDRQASLVLGIQPATVMTHRSHIMRKLGLRHRGELIRAAIRFGYVVIGPDGDLRAGVTGAEEADDIVGISAT